MEFHFLRQNSLPYWKEYHIHISLHFIIPTPWFKRELKTLNCHPLNIRYMIQKDLLLKLNREFCPIICFFSNSLIYVTGLSKIFLPVIYALGYLYAINSLKYEKIASVWTRTSETDGPTENTFGLLQHRISSSRTCYITHKMYSTTVWSR